MSKKREHRTQNHAHPQRGSEADLERLDPVKLKRAANASNEAPVWSDLGVAYMQEGYYESAKAAFKKAIALDPDRGASYFNLGNLELENGFTEQAIAQYELAATKISNDGNVYLNLGNALRKLDRFKDAETAYRRAIELDPKHLVPQVNLGNLLLELAQLHEAVTWYEHALSINQTYVPALIGLGSAYCQLNAYQSAEQTLRRAIGFAPNSAEVHCNLSHLYLATDRPELALEHASHAVRLRPGFAAALSNLGLAQRNKGDLEGAIKSMRESVNSKENYTPALANLAILLKANRQLREALTIYRQAMASAPTDPVPAYNASLILLQLGEFEYGWRLYENRWRAPSFESTRLNTSLPRWNGAPTTQRLLIWQEQGIGDQVMFCSLLPQVEKIARNLQVVIDERLIPIFHRSMPNINFIPSGAGITEEDFDLHIPMGSLPLIFCQNLSAFASIANSYLKPDKSKATYFREKFGGNNKKLCGISWKSGNKVLGVARSIELKKLLDLAYADDVTFVNLQYGESHRDIAMLDGMHYDIQEVAEIDKFQDIDSLFSLIEACDYVISIDNSTVHFAGAIGKPTTVLLPGDRDWRWTEFRNISLWYPSVTYTS